MEQKSQCSGKNIHNQYQLKKVYVNLFDENLSRIFSWFKTTVFHAFFRLFFMILSKEKKCKKIFRLCFSTWSKIFNKQYKLYSRWWYSIDTSFALQVRRKERLILLIHIHWMTKNFRQKFVFFVFYCSKKCGGRRGKRGGTPPNRSTNTLISDW